MKLFYHNRTFLDTLNFEKNTLEKGPLFLQIFQALERLFSTACDTILSIKQKRYKKREDGN